MIRERLRANGAKVKQIFVILTFMFLGQSLHAEVRIAVMGVGNDMNLMERWASSEGSPVNASRSAQSFRVDELHALAPADASDLIILEEEELRSVMSAYELDGRSALVFHDSDVGANAPKASAGGLGKAASTVASISKGGDRNPPPEPQQQGRGQVYLLTAGEAKSGPTSIAGPTPMVIWSDGATATVEITPTRAAAPGDVADVAIYGERGFLGKAGSRFVLIRDESVVGIGVFTEVSRFASPR